MDSSRQAVEAYWRSRMIDGVTSDEDKVAPVYKLEEICELLRTSDAGVVKEVADYVFKRIDHKSPIVKQKALRLIKYAVGKSGVNFRREIHRHSSVIRELFHYRGYPDPLKGDALNKAVRETAHEALSCIFATEDNSSSSTESISNRIQGFGNKNYEMPVQEKRSFLSEVVDIGRASIEQGLNSLASAHSSRKSDSGCYRSPNLRRSLTNERDVHVRDRYERNSDNNTWGSSVLSSSATQRWNNVSTESATAVATNGSAGQSHSGSKSREERLLETIVTSGGVRLQPTRDAIQAFLSEASKLNQLSMCHAIESKLQSNLWQVRMKAMCVLESILRKKDDEKFPIIQSYFSENRDHMIKCSNSPQVSLREKASKVLSLLEGESTSSATSHPGESSTEKNVQTAVPLPDLIDTGFSDGSGNESLQNTTSENPTDVLSTGSLVDLLGDESSSHVEPILSKNEGDPFADVSFHTSDDGKHVDGLFSGLTVDDGKPSIEMNKATSDHTSALLDTFGSEAESISFKPPPGKVEMHDFMSDLTTNGVSTENKRPEGASVEAIFGPTTNFNKVDQHPVGHEFPSGVSSHQPIGMSPNIQFPMGALQYTIPPNMAFNQNFATQTMNYGSMGNFITQQQLLFQNVQGVNSGSHVADGSYSSSLIPDIFHTSSTAALQHTTMRSPKKEETKAFDFISDHLSSARTAK